MKQVDINSAYRFLPAGIKKINRKEKKTESKTAIDYTGYLQYSYN